MQPRVLIVSNYDAPVHNVRPEGEVFVNLHRAGMDIEVMTRADCDYARHLQDCGIKVHDYLPPRKFSLQAIRKIRSTLRASKRNILHLFNNNAIVSGNLAALGMAVKVVTYRGQTGNISRFDPTCYLTHLSPRVDRIVCVANSVRDDLRRQLLTPDKAITIYKGHDIDWYRDIDPVDLSAFGIPPKSFTVVCVANNRPRKGVPALIESAQYIPAEMPVHFLLVGKGMDAAQIRALAHASPRAGRFHLVGYTSRVLPIVAACQAAVLPALRREGLPKTVIEAMACGVAPVVTHTGGNAELVEHGVSGLVVAPGDARALAKAIRSLCEDRARARRMGVAARERLASQFTLEASTAAHRRLYEQLAAELGGS